MKNDPCWKGYEMVGTKKKNGKTVPNCVPVKEMAASILERAIKRKQVCDTSESTDYYPRPGFPKEGEYGYSENPGLKPQESDQDQDMDKAYKVANEKEGKKPLNVKPIEVSNKLEEKRGSEYTLYHKSYTDAVNHALSHHEKSGLKVSDDDRFHHVGLMSKKPSEGNTTSLHLPATHTSGKKHMIHVQVFNKGGTHPYELNTYSSGMGKHVKEEVEDIMERGEDDKGYYRSTESGAGLTRKGAKHFGIKTAVTTPPSKLDPNGKAAKRRKSFCARMGGMKGPMKDEKGRPTRKAMSLRRWNCHEELGKDNEWGRPELRKKFAAVTPGQESLTADKIPVMDPHTGFAPSADKKLNEISAKGAKMRSDFAAKLQKRLADYNASAKKTKQDIQKHQAASDSPSEHLVMQLRKASSIGSKVKFRDGSEHHVAPNHVEKFNDRYHSLKSSIEKESYVKRAHKSHADFMHAISEGVYMMPMVSGGIAAPCTSSVSSANYPTPDQVSPSPEFGDMNNDGKENEWDDAAIEADVTKEIENSNWKDLIQYYDDEDLEDEEDSEDENEVEKEDDISEGLTPQGRLKKKFAAIRTKGRRNLAKKLQLQRVATPDRIKKRSIRAARNMVYKRILRNRDRSTLSAGEKARIEAMVKRMAPTVGRLSIRLQQKERQIDRNRIQNRGKKKK